MNKLARIVSTTLTALALTALTAPVMAAAKDSSPASPAPAPADKKSAPSIDADKLRAHFTAKLAERRALVEQKMERRNLPEATRADIRKSLDLAATKIDAAVAQAAKDGVISKSEAKDVRKLARHLHKDLTAKLKAHKQDKAKSKDKAKKPPRKKIEVKA